MPHKLKKKAQSKTMLQKTSLGVAGVLLVAAGGLLVWQASLRAPVLPKPPLRDLVANQGMRLGMLTKPPQLQQKPFAQVLSSQYSMITSDGEIHWDKFRPSPTAYRYSDMDTLVNYAQRHRMTVQAHHLVWDEEDSLPKWLKNGTYTKDQLFELMHQHIATTVGRYKGRVTEWSVVNEPFSRAQHIYGLGAWWADHTGGGTEYIDKAFKWAREADPNAKLILNDFYNEEGSPVSDAMYGYLTSAKLRGVPIDGVGVQMHIDANYPPHKEAMIANMQRFNALGYKTYITEFDIRIPPKQGSAEQKAKLEAKITSDIVGACVESGNCASFTIFGMKDKNSLTERLMLHRARSYMLDSRYQPKPSFEAFREAWQPQK